MTSLTTQFNLNGNNLQYVLSLSALQTLDTAKIEALHALDIHTLSDLLHYKPIHNAQLIMVIANGKLAHKPNLDHLLDAAYLNHDYSSLPGLPISALYGLGQNSEQIIASSFQVNTIAQLAVFAPYLEAKALLTPPASQFSESPSAPAELLPSIVGAVPSLIRFSSIVREFDLRDLTIKEDGRMPNSHLKTMFLHDENPVFYLGYVAGFSQRWINMGTHLGEIIHSIPLAPGESRNIAMLDWKRHSLTQRDEATQTEEQVNSVQVHKRALDEVARAVAEEHQFGKTSTEANTAVTAGSFVAAGAVIGGIGGGVTGALTGLVVGNVANAAGALPTIGGAIAGSAVGSAAGMAAGGLIYAGANAIGMIESDSSGNREIVADTQQRIAQSTNQKSSAIRSLWSTVVLEDYQGEGQHIQTSTLTNYNHMHALTVQYYEVLQHYRTEIGFDKAEPLLFLPFKPLEFTNAQIEAFWPYLKEALKTELPKELYTTAFTDLPTLDKLLEQIDDTLPPEPEGRFDPEEASVTQILVRTTAGRSLTTIGIEIVKKENEGSEDDSMLIQLHHRKAYTPNSYSNDPKDRDHKWTKPEGLQRLDPPLDSEPSLNPLLESHRIDHFGKPGLKIPVKEIRAIRVINSVGVGELSAVVSVRYTLEQGDHTQPRDDFEAIGPADISGPGSVDVAWDIYEELTANFQSYDDDLTLHDEAVADLAQAKIDAETSLAEMETAKADALMEIYNLIRWHKYRFSRYLLFLTEPEQISDVLDSLSVAGIPLHTLAHTIPVGVVGNHLILKLKGTTGKTARRYVRLPHTIVVPKQGSKDELQALVTVVKQIMLNPPDFSRLTPATATSQFIEILDELKMEMYTLQHDLTNEKLASHNLDELQGWSSLKAYLQTAVDRIAIMLQSLHKDNNASPEALRDLYNGLLELLRRLSTFEPLLTDETNDAQSELTKLLGYTDDVTTFFNRHHGRKSTTDDVYLPTSGVFAEAILGRSNAAEKLDMTRFFNWQDSPIPHIAPAIAATDPNQQRDENTQPIPTLPPATINLVNPVSFPDPTGLAGVLQAVQNGDMFRDMSKTDQLTTILGGLATLAGDMGKASADMTGDAAQQTMQSATDIGKTVAGLTQSLIGSANKQLAAPPSNMTEKGATLNALDGMGQPETGSSTNVNSASKDATPLSQNVAKLNTLGLDKGEQDEPSQEKPPNQETLPKTKKPSQGYIEVRSDNEVLLAGFDIEGATLKSAHETVLDQLVEAMERDQLEITALYGRASQTGQVEFNKKLSLRRIEAVMDYIQCQTTLPVSPKLVPLGESTPLDISGPLENSADRSVQIFFNATVTIPGSSEPVQDNNPTLQRSANWSFRVKTSDGSKGIGTKALVIAYKLEIKNRDTGEIISGRMVLGGFGYAVNLINQQREWSAWHDFTSIKPIANHEWQNIWVRVTRLAADIYIANADIMFLYFYGLMSHDTDAIWVESLFNVDGDGAIGIRGEAFIHGQVKLDGAHLK